MVIRFALNKNKSKGRRTTSGLTWHQLLCQDFSYQFESFSNLHGSTVA